MIKKKKIILSKDMAPRIVAGRFRNAALKFYKTESRSGIRAVTRRAREMIFSWLSSRLMKKNSLNSGSVSFAQLNTVDCFAGFGSYGFEAISRGAKHCLFIENNPIQQQLIMETAQKFQLHNDEMELWTGMLPESMVAMPYGHKTDILFIAPPYAKIPLGEQVLRQWTQCTDHSFAIFEAMKTYDFPEKVGLWFLIEERRCGLAKVGFYCTNEEEKNNKMFFTEREGAETDLDTEIE
jgi:16S rRNA (guanine(966)-N(2))-methyltransferase RsmD